METPIEFVRIRDFKERLKEMGILDDILFEEVTTIPYRYTITVTKYSELTCHALMGLIAHFENRKWCKGWAYMYIMKSIHKVTFTNQSD